MSTVILGTGSTACTRADVSRILNMCRRVMETEQFQALEDITVRENDNFEEMIDTLLLNCIESTTHPNIRERAVAAICYVVKIYRLSSMPVRVKEEFLETFMKALRKYNVSWTISNSPISHVFTILTFIALNSLFYFCTYDVNRN